MIWAIVPVKPLLLGKSRLAGAVPPQARALLNRMMLEHTLEILRDTAGIAQTLVVSRDPEALAIAREFDARTLLEQGNSHLNAALERATAVSRVYNARGVLVLPADLPLLTADDLAAILFLAAPAPVVILAPDRHDGGTNALLISPPGQINYSFGPASFARHARSAQGAGARLEIVRRPTLSLDLDVPEDLDLLLEVPPRRPPPQPVPTELPASETPAAKEAG